MNDMPLHEAPMCTICGRRSIPTERLIGGLYITFTGCDCQWNDICASAFGHALKSGFFAHCDLQVPALGNPVHRDEKVDMGGWLIDDPAEAHANGTRGEGEHGEGDSQDS